MSDNRPAGVRTARRLKQRRDRTVRRRWRTAALGAAGLLALGLLPLSAPPAIAATPIMGTPVLTAGQLAAYFDATSPAPAKLTVGSIGTLAAYYIDEGKAAGIRGDIAFAQAIHETGWFQYGGDVPWDHNNFAGLGATGNGVEGNEFATARQGVRAQLHHLRAYADAQMIEYAQYPDVDPGWLQPPPVIPENETRPRFTLFGPERYGSAPSWEGLTGTWATDPTYHEKVLARWHDLLQFSGHRLDDAIPLRGDWNGNGRDTPGWYLNGRVMLTNRTDQTSPQIVYTYGRKGDIPVVGDWNGNGRDTVSILRGRTWHIRNALSGGAADHSFVYGRLHEGDYALAGDWNGNGRDTPGIVRGGEWHLRNSLSGGAAHLVFTYGRVRDGDVPLTGDWNGNGRHTPAIVRGKEWHVRNANAGGPADLVFTYGNASDTPLAGNWNGSGGDTPGVVRGAHWYLRNHLSGGAASIDFRFNAH